MDRWSLEQVTRMDKGGNACAREFFETKFGAAYKTMTIPEKVWPLIQRVHYIFNLLGLL